jgi:hypothetical protein
MNQPTEVEAELIPPPGVVRAELARSVRESRRLRALLRLSMQVVEDRHYVRSLARRDQEPAGRGLAR